MLCLLCLGPAAHGAMFYHVSGASAGSWPAVLESVGLIGTTIEEAEVLVVRPDSGLIHTEIGRMADRGVLVVLEGASPAVEGFGIRPGSKEVKAQSVVDKRAPDLRIVWEKAARLPVFELPPDFEVLAYERWEKAPLVAGRRQGRGGILWVASSPGPEGYERYPYLLHALADLGFEAPFRSRRLAVFFDYSYRIRVDLDYFAALWRRIGVGSLQVTAWPFWEADPGRDEYLRRLIEACHKQGILVYAWLELPHVSEQFWQDHPEWREKTALGQDAHLDWRKLMNLQNRDCVRAVSAGVRELMDRFEWDGINLAELYFESLQSYLNPSRFTPLNDEVRGEFRRLHGFDPLEIWDEGSARHHRKTVDGIRAFLDYRAGLAQRMQEEWLAEMEAIRATNPELDLILTHVDDRFDTQMRDAIGADAARLLPLLEQYDFTFLIEDPATIWHLGPKRYPEIARRYQPLTARQDKLAIDINIVERYQDVYPTKKQTGTELFQLVHLASQAFPLVALYFENSILPQDRDLLPAAAAAVKTVERIPGGLRIASDHGTGLRWRGPARVNGRLWPYQNEGTVWLPAGEVTVEPAVHEPLYRLADFSGTLLDARIVEGGLEIVYESSARALAILEERPIEVLVNGSPVDARMLDAGPSAVVYLPRGRHRARLILGPPDAASRTH